MAILALGALQSWARAPESKSLTLSQACKAQSPVEVSSIAVTKAATPV